MTDAAPPPEPTTEARAADPSPGIPWTVRIADWSARHRWPVFVLWFAATIGLFIASLAAGGTNSAEAVSNDDRAKYEAAEAFVVWNAANAGAQSEEKASAQFLLVVTNPDGTIDDAAYRDCCIGIDRLYRDVAGVKIPFKKTVSQTYMRMDVELTDVQPNVPLDAARFNRPAAFKKG